MTEQCYQSDGKFPPRTSVVLRVAGVVPPLAQPRAAGGPRLAAPQARQHAARGGRAAPARRPRAPAPGRAAGGGRRRGRGGLRQTSLWGCYRYIETFIKCARISILI